MWTYNHKDGTPVEFNPIDRYKKERCPLCGQYFRKGDKACLVIPPMEFRKSEKKLSQNMMIHINEWNAFCEGITSDAELALKFIQHRKPRAKKPEGDDLKRIDAFRSACHDYGYYEEFKKPYGLKCQKRGTSAYLEYDTYADSIYMGIRGKRGLFDSFFEKEIIAKIYTKIHQYLGDGKEDHFNSAEEIGKVMTEAKKMVDSIM